MHWSLATILLALLFAAASPQRGGRRYLPDQPLEESLSVENHRFQTRGRGNVEGAGRGESRRTRTQETTEINSRSFSGRSRVKSEEPRQFHSRSGKEQETKPAERQVLSRRNHETETRRLSSREETRNERFKSRDATTVTEGPLRKQVRTRGRQSTDGREVEYKTRGTESNRFSSRSQERGEPIRGSQENVRASVGEFQRSGSRDRVQATRRSNVIETPQNIEPVTERFHTRNLALENTQKSKTEDTTEKTVQIDHFTPITEAKIQDLTSRSNSIEPEKRTKPADVSVTEKQHSRQSVRSEVRKSRIDSLEENNEQSRVRGRNKIQEIPTRGAGTESRRRTRPTEATANERFHSRQSAKEEQPSRRGRVHTSPDNLRSDSGQLKGSRRSQDFISRGNTPEHDRRRTSDVTSTEKFHPRQSVREKSHRVEDWTTEYRALPATTEAGKVPDLPNKEVNTIDVDSKLSTENLISELTTETKLNSELEDSKAVTKQPNLLSTENTVDIPIKSNDVEEPSRASRKLDPSGPERNNHHRGQNRDFENSKRGRLESSLSRERSRTQETSTRGGEGRRASRRFSSQRPESPKDIEDNRGRRKLQRLSSRTKDLDTPIVHGRQIQEQLPARHRLPPTGLGIEERTTEGLLLPSPLTESGIDNKVSTVSLSQSEHTNEVTVGVPSASSVATTPRLTERNTNRKPGNRGRGQLKATKILEEKDVSGEVSDDDNYPEVYKQLKKSGTDPKEILALLKARKGVRDNLEKTNTKIPQPHSSLTPNQRPVFGSDESRTPLRKEVKVPNPNFRTHKYKSETLNQRSESKSVSEEKTENILSSTERNDRFLNFRKNRFKPQKNLKQNTDTQITETSSETIELIQKDEPQSEQKYNPYNYQEIRSFNKKKNTLTTPRKTNLRDSSKVSDDKKKDEKTDQPDNKPSPVEPKGKPSLAGPAISRFRDPINNNIRYNNKGENMKKQNDESIEETNEQKPKPVRRFTGPGVSKFRSSFKSNKDEKKIEEEAKEINQNTESIDSFKERKFGLTGPGDRYRKRFNSEPETKEEKNDEILENKSIETESNKSQRRTSFTSRGKGRDIVSNRKELNTGTPSPEVQTETNKPRSKYVPRNRKTDQERFKSRSEKTLEDVLKEPSIKEKNDLFSRNEHSSFRRRSFSTTAQGVDIVPTAEYPSPVTPRNRPAFFPQRRKYGKTATSPSPLPLNRFKQRKVPLSKLFTEDLKEEEEDLRPNINDLSIDSLVSESEQSSFTTEAEIISRKRPRYTESHIQRVPPKRRGSGYYKLSSFLATSSMKPEVYTVLAVPYYDESVSVPESTSTIALTELDSDISAESTTTLNEIVDTTTPISTTTDIASTTVSTTEAPSTTVTEPPSSSTTSVFTTESTTSRTTTTEPTTTRTTTEQTTTTTEPTTARTTTTEPTTTRTTTELLTTSTEPTTSTTEITTSTTTQTTTTTTTTTKPTTTTTTTKPTTTTTTTKPTMKTATKKPTTTTTTKKPTTTTTTKKPTTTTTTKKPTTTTTTKKPTTTTTTTKPTTTTTTKKPTTTTTTKKPVKPTSTTQRTTMTKPTTIKTTKLTTTKPKTIAKKAQVTKQFQQTASTISLQQLKPPTTTTRATPKTTKGTTRSPNTAKPTTIKATTKAGTLKTTKKQQSSTVVTPYNTSTPSTKENHSTTTFKIDELLSTTHPNFLTTIAYLARNLTVQTTPYNTANTANFRAPSAQRENTTPVEQPTTAKTDNYVVYGLLSNNNVVRKVVKTTKAPVDIPFYIYGLYPNGTIVRRFPNGTIVPDETEEENEVIGRVEPGSQESLETVVKKDNPLSYLYPPGFEKTTKTSYVSSTTTKTTTENDMTSTVDILPIDPRIAPSPSVSNLEKPGIEIKNTIDTSDTSEKPAKIKSTTKTTTNKPTTKGTTSKPPVKPTTTKPPTKATTIKPTVKPTTAKPPTKATTIKPKVKPTSATPATKQATPKATTKKTTKPTTTKATTRATTTAKPTTKAATSKPTTKPTTSKATTQKTTVKPITTKQTTKTPARTASTVKPKANKPPSTTTTKKALPTKPHTTNGKATTALISDAELLNNLLNQEVKEIIPKGTTESTADLADKVIQLAIERAQKSTTGSPHLKEISSTDNQLLTSSPKKQSSGRKNTDKTKLSGEGTNANNKTGKISVWVIPPEESTTSKPVSGVSKSELELLNALLSTPNTLENLSLSDQLLLADVLSSTGLPQTTKKKKKKPKTTTTTTPPPPVFPILQYLFGRNRGGGGGLFQRGLFRGGGLRGLESGGVTPQDDGGIFQNDGLPQGVGELAAESQNDPQQGSSERGGLVNAAINVSRAVSQFMGFVIQGAAQSFQNYFQTRTRALTDALSYPAQ